MNISQFKKNNEMLTSPVTKKLQGVLSNTYGLYLATNNYHWNVEGPQFASLHELFEKQYTEMAGAIDDIAERIRALGDYAMPFQDAKIMESLKNVSNPITQGGSSSEKAMSMVQNLITLSEAVVESLQSAKEAAVEAGDDETEDMMIERIATHQKNMWMLKSIVA